MSGIVVEFHGGQLDGEQRAYQVDDLAQRRLVIHRFGASDLVYVERARVGDVARYDFQPDGGQDRASDEGSE